MDEQKQPPVDSQSQLTSDTLFDDLLEQYITVGLSDGEWDNLAPLMDKDPEAIRRYAEAVHMRELLQDFAGGMPPFKSLLPEGLGIEGSTSSSAPDSIPKANKSESRSSTEESPPRLANRSDFSLSDNPSIRLGNNHGSNLIQRSNLNWSSWLSLASAVCMALFVGLASGYYFAGSSKTTTKNDYNNGLNQVAELDAKPGSTKSASDPIASLQGSDLALASKESLGRITGLSPEASADGLLRSFQVGEELRRGEVVQLSSGLMQVSFADGPIAMIQGPAEFSVVADRGLYVKHGHIKTTAVGNFELQTPLIRIDSQDAEIDVIVDRDNSTSVYSYTGQADIHSNSKRLLHDKLLRSLGEQQGIQVSNSSSENDLVIADASAPKALVASWKEVNKSLHPYEQDVLADKPLAYWPLHRVQRNRRVLDLSQNGFDGQAVGDWPIELSEADSKQARGAYFSGESYIEPDSKPPVDLKTGFTIESWANVSGGPEFQSIFTSRWVFGSNTPNQQCFGFTLYAGDDDHWQFWSGSGEYGAEWQILKAPTKVKRHQWTHVAASFQPFSEEQQPEAAAGQWVEGVVKLYVGGEEVAQATHRMSLMDFEWPARIGAAEFVPKSLTSWLFQGELRDIALYDYVVSKDRIKSHNKAGASAI